MGLLRLYSKVTFTKDGGETYTFNDYVNGMETDSSYENLTDTFKITMPRAGSFKGKQLFSGDSPIFERGDQVKVEMGYYPNLVTVFEGWVSTISAKIPVEITCEDDMYILKNTNVTFPSKALQSFVYFSKKKHKPLKHPKYLGPAVTLKELLSTLMPDDIPFECPDVNLGLFRISNASVSKALEELKSKYGLFSFFRDGTLHCGLPSNPADTQTHEFVFEKCTPWSVIDDSDLEYQLAKDINIKVVAKLMGANNTWEEVTVGDTDGAQRSFFLYWDPDSGNPKPSLKDFAQLKLDEVKYDGFRGSFETFGYKYVRHGDIVKLNSTKLPERNGSYLVVSVKRNFGMDGYRQTIELGNKVG